jgi:hypothetical protein
MSRSAYFTVIVAELESAPETVQKLAASATKIAEATRPRRLVDGDEVFMVVSWIFDERRWDLPDGGRRWEGVYVGRLRFSQLGFQARRKRYTHQSAGA